MRYYSSGDGGYSAFCSQPGFLTVRKDIYFFGFSRGAYVARFLAEMLDHVGLLSAGNEELVGLTVNTFDSYIKVHARLGLRGKLLRAGNSGRNQPLKRRRSVTRCLSFSKVTSRVDKDTKKQFLTLSRISRDL